MNTTHTPNPSLADIHRALSAFRKPDPARYFIDLGLSATIGWLLFWLALTAGNPGLRLLALGASALALYRALAFIHELVHQRELRIFRAFWHVVAGIPLLLPLLLYLPIHRDHHSARSYGTPADGEYDNFKGRLGLMVSKLFIINFFLPLALLVRFAVLTPLALWVPIVQREVIPAFVHLALRIPFKAPPLAESALQESRLYEWGCTAFSWLLIGAWLSGHGAVVLAWAALLVLIATLNTVRALVSTHLYVEQAQGRDLEGQLSDSINIEGHSPLTQLLCPVGLQYHALHHLAPQLPYHQLSAAHAHLSAILPADSSYRHSTVGSALAGWQRLVAATRRS